MSVPVAFLIFNRPQTTRQVFAAIRAARPARLLVVADGPRKDRPGEAERCAETRAIIDQVDWPCVVERNFAAENLGCRARVASGLDWVFSRVEEAIILEDDCLPHPDFFSFCAELLQRYREDPRIMTICGNNFHPHVRLNASYHFSKYFYMWGWATWRRAWQHYDESMAEWRERRDLGWPAEAFLNRYEREYWADHFDLVANGYSTWDYQWFHACWRHQALNVVPATNLVTNIGFGSEATHTINFDPRANVPSRPLGPMRHPVEFAFHPEADAYDFEHALEGKRRYPLARAEEALRRPLRKFRNYVFGKLGLCPRSPRVSPAS
jgi:glycosyltransferase involved in cell wall biosynthesis